jgi:uncharacterized phage-associated protein
MTYNSYDIAKYIMYRCEEKKKSDPKFSYNNTKIQKILFAAYGTLLAQCGDSFIDESPKMWPYGPVFPRVFENIKKENFKPQDMQFEDPKVKQLIDMAVDFFGKFSAKALSDWSHEKGSPWSQTKEIYGPSWNMEIQRKDIEEYFRKIMANG